MSATASGKRVSIQDVAKETGLSITTVSHALSGKGRISERSRAVVREAADRLGYRPDPLAAALVSGRVGVIGLAVGHVGSAHWERTYRPYYAAITSGATMLAIERGIALVVVPTTPSSGGLWTRVPLDGLIVVDPVHDDPVLTECRRIGLPVVADGRPIDPGFEDVPAIDSDVERGLFQVLDHLWDSGARRPALFTGTEEDSYTIDCTAAYQDWCGAHRVAPLVAAFAPGADPVVTAEALLAGPDSPDAVHCLNETYAEALFTAARRQDLGIPQDLLVTSMCETVEDKHWDVPLTVLSLNAEQLGATAAAALLDLLGGRAPNLARVEPTLVVRASSGTRGRRAH